MQSAPANTHATKLDASRRRVFSGSLLAVSAFIGLRIAVETYSGPSIPLGLGIGVMIAVALWQSFLRLPEAAGRALYYVCSFLLM